MSKGSKSAASRGANGVRLGHFIAFTAVCSFMLGILYSAVHTKPDPLVEEAPMDEAQAGSIPFFLKDSLSAVRTRVSDGLKASSDSSIQVAYKETTVSMTTGQKDERKYIKIFIGIFTAAGSPAKRYDQRRKAIRDTWLSKTSSYPDIEAYFISGQASDPAMQASIEQEQAAHEDFIFVDMQECYTCLPQKTLAFLEMVAAAYYADWVIKMDDDVYLSYHRLRLAIMQWSRMHADYIGCMKHGIVHGDPKSKWFEPAQLLIGREYHMNAYGSIYVLNGRVIDDVVIPNKARLRLLANEDTSVGLWMSAFQVRFFEDMRLCSVRCHPAGVAFLDNQCSGLCNPILDMYRAHKNVQCRRLVKAPLPYMPSFKGNEAFHSMRVR